MFRLPCPRKHRHCLASGLHLHPSQHHQVSSSPFISTQHNVRYSHIHPDDDSAHAVLTYAVGTFPTIEHSASSPLIMVSSLATRTRDSPRRQPYELRRCTGSSSSRGGIASTGRAGPPALAHAARRARQGGSSAALRILKFSRGSLRRA